MKKLLTILLSLLIPITSYGVELNTLFGISLLDNAEKHFSSNYIESNKFKNDETIDGYFSLVITDEIKSKSPYANWYQIVIDNENTIHRIYGDSDFTNLDICQAVRKDLLSKFEKKYAINFEYFEESYPEFKIYADYQFVGPYQTNSIRIQCRESYIDSSTLLQIMLNSFNLIDAVNDYYDSGL
jgi:hypothetical protein